MILNVGAQLVAILVAIELALNRAAERTRRERELVAWVAFVLARVTILDIGVLAVILDETRDVPKLHVI